MLAKSMHNSVLGMSETAWCPKSLGKYWFAHFPFLLTLINHLKFRESTTDVRMQYGLLHSQSDMFTTIRSYNDTTTLGML